MFTLTSPVELLHAKEGTVKVYCGPLSITMRTTSLTVTQPFTVKVKFTKPLVMSVADAVYVGVNVVAPVNVPPVVLVHNTLEYGLLAVPASKAIGLVLQMVSSAPAFTTGANVSVTGIVIPVGGQP